jgi:hypothetical protein
LSTAPCESLQHEPSVLPPLAWLVVRAGLHKGAAVPLHEGRWRVGSTLDDEVVLRDAGVEPAHIEIMVSQQTLELRARAPGWLLDGQALSASADTAQVLGARRAQPAALRLGEAVLELAWVQTAPARKTTLSWLSWLLGKLDLADRRTRWALVSGAIGCAVLSVLFAWVATPVKAPDQASGVADPARLLERRLQDNPGWQRVRLTRIGGTAGGGGHVELNGRVERRDELDALVRSPEVAALAPVVRVLVEQELRRQIHEVTGDSKIDVAIETVAGEGAASAAGPAGPAAERQRVVVSGSTQRAGVAASLKLLNNELGARVEIVDRTVYEPDERDRKTVRVELPIRIASVNAGEGYIESTDGQKYFEGSVVSGYTVETIEADKVVFNVAGKRIEFPVR